MQDVINQLQALLNEYTPRFYSITTEEFSFKTSAVKWSKKEILGHLVDSAQNNIQRFVRVQYEHKPHITYNQDIWVGAQGYKDYSKDDLIMLWQLLNKHICIILGNMSADVYGLECNTGKHEEKLYTVKFLAEDYITHLQHHLKQIFNN